MTFRGHSFDFLIVTGTTDDGLLEGTTRSGGSKSGLFPPHCVQEVRLRHHNIQAPMMVARDTRPPSNKTNNGRVLGRRENTSKHFATAPRLKKTYVPKNLQLFFSQLN